MTKISNDEKDGELYSLEDGVRADGSLWILIPQAALGIGVSIAIVLVRFWAEFGYIPTFAIGFSTFLAAFQVLLIVGFRFADRTDVHTTVKPKNDKFDELGSWWLMACVFGAFFGWLAGNMVSLIPDQWRVVMTVKVFFTIVVPVVTMVPNLRYISRNSAFIQIPLLTVVTMLPVLIGTGALISLITGVIP